MVIRKARRAIGDFLSSVARSLRDLNAQPERTYAYVFGLNRWKRNYVARCYPEFAMRFLRRTDLPRAAVRRVKRGKPFVFIVWGYKCADEVVEFASRHGIPLYRMEDGFVRSVGLGAAHTLPRSLVLDRSGRLYFDASGATELERICSEYDFASDPSLLDEARACLELLMQERISKYNHVSSNEAPEEAFERLSPRVPGRKRILVIGQVEDDASLRQGGASHLSNFLAVKAATTDHPDADVIFKPHPDDLGGFTKNRPKKSTLEEIERIAKVLRAPMTVPDSFACVDHVYTITSLAGFEALLRGKPVTVLGYPFYAGWGLTEDRQTNPRRTRRLTLLELFAAAYLLYPRYFDPKTCEPSSARETILAIARERAERSGVRT
jgi:capsule polysaccharide export protein KpsC/LpsZ